MFKIVLYLLFFSVTISNNAYGKNTNKKILAKKTQKESKVKNTSNGYDSSRIYIGFGIGNNTLDSVLYSLKPDAIGFQIYAGYLFPFEIFDGASLAVESGYYSSGGMEYDCGIYGECTTKATGIWLNAVTQMSIQKKLSAMFRLGVDAGDDEGFMYGGGIKYQFTPKFGIQSELIIRKNINTIMFSADIPFNDVRSLF